MALKVGVILPTSTPDPAHPILGDVKASARFAEELQLDSIWSTDHLIASAPMPDSVVVLAAAAGATDRIQIGFNVLILALRPVAWAAKQISALQYVSGNRVQLGIGTGNPAHGDLGWRAAGVAFEGRGSRTDEALRVLPSLVTGQATELADDLTVTLAPGAPMPPVLIAGNGSAALRRTAEFGEGWISLGLAPGDIATGLAEIGRQAAERGRPAPKATIVAPALSDDPKHAAEELAAYASVGTERAILAPTGADWRRDYEYAAAVRAAL